jgi:hypothetical protein
MKIYRIAQLMSQDENASLKRIYVHLKSIFEEIRTNYASGGGSQDVISFMRNFKPSSFYKENTWNYSTSVTPDIQSTFPQLGSKFRITIKRNIEPGLSRIGDEVVGIEMPFEKIIDGTYNVSLQHEIQHIKHGDQYGTGVDAEEGIISTINYMLDPNEIAAHAKQFSYQYYKQFPEDTSLDFNKLVQTFGSDVKLTNYVKFLNNAQDIVNKRPELNQHPDIINRMIEGGKTFQANTVEFFTYYLQSSQQN